MMKFSIIRRCGLVALLATAACTSTAPVNPDDTPDPLSIRPQSLTASLAADSLGIRGSGTAVVSLAWTVPAGSEPIGGYTVVREFEDDGPDTIVCFKGAPDTVRSFRVDSLYEGVDTLYDTVWTINVTVDDAGLPLTYDDDITPLFDSLVTVIDTNIVYIDPLVDKRKTILIEGVEYELKYNVMAWQLQDQDYVGALADWLLIPLYSTYGYYGQYSETVTIKITTKITADNYIVRFTQ